MKTKLTLSLILCASTLAGCTSMQSKPDNRTAAEQQADHDATKKGAIKGAVIGCVGGAFVGVIRGGGGAAIKGCVIGGAAGGVVGGVVAHRQQLAAAQTLKTEAEAAGARAQLTTTTKMETTGSGKAEPVESLERLTIDLPAESANRAQIAGKVAAMAAQSKVPVTIQVMGAPAVASQIRSQLPAGGQTTVTEFPSGKAQLVLTPVPDTRA